MNIGKLPNELLEKLILNAIKTRRSETIVSPAVGEDCCVLDLGENLCVISTDPITAANENAGVLAVLVSLNDLASCGAEPVGILTTALLPPDTDEKSIIKLFGNINKTCEKMNIDVLGGHTEITDAVKKTILITTAIGKVPKNGLVKSEGAKVGDVILMTKAVALEGTSIIASDKNIEVRQILSDDEFENAKSFINQISVVEEGLTAARYGATSMHDITEGGILGAIWEVCKASEKGAEIHLEKIPVKSETIKICDFYGISPYKLISSGSMLITCNKKSVKKITKSIKEKGIDCTEIGEITELEKVLIIKKGKTEELKPPSADELYKLI